MENRPNVDDFQEFCHRYIGSMFSFWSKKHQAFIPFTVQDALVESVGYRHIKDFQKWQVVGVSYIPSKQALCGVSTKEVRPTSFESFERQGAIPDFSLPSQGYRLTTNKGGYKSALYISRRPRRQYRMGAPIRAYNIEDVSIRERRILEGRNKTRVIGPHDYNKIKTFSLFNPSFPSYQEALKGIQGGEFISCPISLNWALKVSIKHAVICLDYKNFTVGAIKNDIPTLYPDYIYLSDDLEELIEGEDDGRFDYSEDVRA